MIRALTSADLPQLDALVRASRVEGFAFLERLQRALDVADHGASAEPQSFLGVFEGPALMAVGGVTPDPYTADAGVGRIRHVYVAAKARRRGVGRRLMHALEAYGATRYRVLRLRTDTAPAAAFYEALGYLRSTEPDTTHRRELVRANDAATPA